MTKREKQLITHFVKIWNAPYIPNKKVQDRIYSEAEEFIHKKYLMEVQKKDYWLETTIAGMTDGEKFQELLEKED